MARPSLWCKAHPRETWQHLTVVPPSLPPPSQGSSAPPESSPPDGGTREGPPHFSVFGVPVRVTLGFWVITLLFGISFRNKLALGFAWTLIVFVSVLLHELGHAVVARRYGARPAITLHGFGGLTTYADPGGLTRPRRAWISLAGPFAGFLFGGLVLFFTRSAFVGKLTEGQQMIRSMVAFVNIGWGIINLLPVLPFDGGHVLEAALGPKRAITTRVVGAIVAVGVAAAAVALLKQAFIIPLFFGLAAWTNYQQARQLWAAGIDQRDGVEALLRDARTALEAGDLDQAYALAQEVVQRAQTLPVRNGGFTALAWVAITRGNGALARAAVREVTPQWAVDPYTLAAVEDCAGDEDGARRVLEEARRHGLRAVEMTKLHVDLLARQGRIADAVALAFEDADLLPVADARAVVRAGIEADVLRPAAELAARLFELHRQAEDAVEEARAHALLGDGTAALTALAHAVAAGGLDKARLLADPAFSPLSSDPRFSTLVGS